MIQINIKPLSANILWRGRKFKTPEYTKYEKMCLLLLPKQYEVPNGKLILTFEFGLSNKANDSSNCVKAIEDILQKKYGFNDKMVYRLIVDKKDVQKGSEYIKFKIEPYVEEK